MKKLIILFCFIIFTSELSYASQFGGIDAGAINTQYMKDLRFHEATSRVRNKKTAIMSENKTEAEKITDYADLTSIVFVNNKNVSTDELLKVIKDKINQPMNPENIAQIRRDIMRYYQSLGYYSAVALISSQDNQTGELVIDIQEGTQNSIMIQE